MRGPHFLKDMSFGESLRRERELRGIDLREIAEATKISIRFLKALEQDRPDILPGGLFPQAFVRQYARHLGLDPDKAVSEFLYAHRAAAAEKTAKPAPRAGPGPLPALVVGVVVLGAALALWRGHRSERPSAEPAAVTSMPLTYPSDRVYPPPSVAQASARPATEGLSLKLSARQGCWVAVQADNVTVLNRVLAQGETQTLEAKSEIVLSVGNAGGIAAAVNDRPLAPLGAPGEVRRNVVITRDSLPSLLEPARPGTPSPGPSRPPSPSPASAPSAAPGAPAPAASPEG